MTSLSLFGFFSFLWLRPASRFDRHFQTHRTRLGRPFIAYQLYTHGPHIVTSYMWAGVVSTDQIRSDAHDQSRDNGGFRRRNGRLVVDDDTHVEDDEGDEDVDNSS